MLKHYEAHAPLKRNVLPDELGATGTFLASDGAAAITGQVLYVDCGYQINYESDRCTLDGPIPCRDFARRFACAGPLPAPSPDGIRFARPGLWPNASAPPNRMKTPRFTGP